MRRLLSTFILANLLTGVPAFGAGNDEEGRGSRARIKWPNPAFRSLQSAIDAAPEGALIEIKEGIHSIDPVFIRKRLEIAGAGSGGTRRNTRRMTKLVGRPPVPVVDARGNLLLPASAVLGSFNVVAAGVQIRDLMLTGSDAAIVIRNDDERRSGSTSIRNTVISHAGRGIVALGSGALIVQNAVIQETLWHGISVQGQFAGLQQNLAPILVSETTILSPQCAGIYFENTIGIYGNVSVVGASCGGLVGFRSSAWIFDSLLLANRKAGIILAEAIGQPRIERNSILGTLPTPFLSLFGDGVSIFSSPDVLLVDNEIENSARAGVGVYGSSVQLGGNTIRCSAFDIDYETYQEVNGILNDLGGNKCGCGGPFVTCVGVSSNLAPPPLDVP